MPTMPFPSPNNYPMDAHWSKYGGAQICNAILFNSGTALPSSWYLGLLKWDLSTSIVETTGAGYNRKGISFAAPTTVSGYDYVETNVDIVFDIPTGNPDVVSFVGLYDAATGGNLWAEFQLPAQKFIWSGYTWAIYEMAYAGLGSKSGISGSQPVDGDTLSIGAVVFTWRDTPSAATDIQTAGDPAAASDNMVTTVMAEGTYSASHIMITQSQDQFEDAVIVWDVSNSLAQLDQSLSVKGSGWLHPYLQQEGKQLTIPSGHLYYYLQGDSGNRYMLPNAVRNSLFSALFAGGSLPTLGAAPLMASLHTGDPLDDLSLVVATEVTAGDYARFTVVFETPGTSGNELSIGLTTTITQPAASAASNWGTISWIVIWDNGGTGLLRIRVNPAVTINTGDQIQFHDSTPNYSASGIILDWWI